MFKAITSIMDLLETTEMVFEDSIALGKSEKQLFYVLFSTLNSSFSAIVLIRVRNRSLASL